MQKGSSVEDEAAVKAAEECIRDCHPEQLITESKFLRIDSLQELVKVGFHFHPLPPGIRLNSSLLLANELRCHLQAIIFASHGPDAPASSCGGYDQESTVFFLELLIKIVIQNR